MRKIGFVGAFDKTDFIIYTARILAEMEKKVLVVDTTINQRAKYVVPSLEPTKTYITNFEDIDVAVGYKSFEDIKSYLGMENTEELDYDYIFVDIDSYEMLNSFNAINFNKNYFVTSFDVYSLRRGLEILSGLQYPLPMKKILFTKSALKEEEEYLDFLSLGYKIEWDKERIFMPFDIGDQSIIYENQRVSKIKFKKLSNQYKMGLQFVASEITEFNNDALVKKAFKTIEKSI